ncbi:hypothetical protein BH10PSE12_BH10PSE12_14510 [soil metagenome]
MSIFPRPVSPKSALGDFWSYFAERRAHKWPLLGLSAAFTWVIIWAFIIDGQTNIMPRQNKIIYFESWNADRTDATIIMQQKMDLARSEILVKKKQKEMQGVADAFGVEWRTEAARNSAKRTVAIRTINEQLDARQAKAEAQEKGAAAKPAPEKAKVAKP